MTVPDESLTKPEAVACKHEQTCPEEFNIIEEPNKPAIVSV